MAMGVTPVALTSTAARTEGQMRKPNYHQVKKQKELSRKARQQEKQQRKADRTEPDGVSAQPGALEGSKSTDDPIGSGA